MQRGIKLGLYGLVLAGVIGGTVGWAGEGKSVALEIDGQTRTVHTTASDVSGVLKSAHVSVGAHDIVAPDESAHIRNGGKIVIDRGHLLHLTVDGKTRDVWVNADSVAEALSQLGFGAADAVSVSRAKRLDVGTTDIAITSPKRVVFRVDKRTVVIDSAGPTVEDAAKAAHIFIGPHDRVSAPVHSALKDNQIITIRRVRYAEQTADVPVPFGVTKQNDPSSLAGNESTVSAGQNGVNRVTYQLVYVDGQLSGKVVLSTSVLKAPVNQVDKVGTQQPTVTPANQAQAIAEKMVAARGWDNSQFSCLVSLWSKESGWRTNAANPSGAYGIPQALPGSKMASAGADWQTNAATQITWGLNYIAGVYGTPCAAWAHSQATNWY